MPREAEQGCSGAGAFRGGEKRTAFALAPAHPACQPANHSSSYSALRLWIPTNAQILPWEGLVRQGLGLMDLGWEPGLGKLGTDNGHPEVLHMPDPLAPGLSTVPGLKRGQWAEEHAPSSKCYKHLNVSCGQGCVPSQAIAPASKHQ